MNPLALLSAIAWRVAFFPGVAYAGVVAAGGRRCAGRLPAGLRPAQLDELMAAVGVSRRLRAAGASRARPSSACPRGVSLAVLVTALAAGHRPGAAAERWPWHRLVAAATAAGAHCSALASVAMTLDLRTIAAAGGSGGRRPAPGPSSPS